MLKKEYDDEIRPYLDKYMASKKIIEEELSAVRGERDEIIEAAKDKCKSDIILVKQRLEDVEKNNLPKLNEYVKRQVKAKKTKNFLRLE